MFDLLISNARIHDGLGSTPFTGQLAVKDGRIAAVRREDSPIPTNQALQNVDAKGLALMPGIIDNHTHYDAQITWDPYLDQSVGSAGNSAATGSMSAPRSSATVVSRSRPAAPTPHRETSSPRT